MANPGYSIEDVHENGRVIGWRVRWRDSDGAQREKRFLKAKGYTRTIAKKYGIGEIAARNRNEDVVYSRMTFAEFARRNLDDRRDNLRPKSISVYGYRVRHVEQHPTFGRRRVVDAVDHFGSYVKWLSRPKSDGGAGLDKSSACGDAGYLHGVFAAAARQRLITYAQLMAVKDIKGPDYDRARYVPLTYVQVRRIADAMEPHMRAEVLIQAALGLRVSELRALRPVDITWPIQVAGGRALRTARQGSVRIDWQLDAHGERVAVKSKNGHRDVPMGPRVASVLRAHMDDHEPERGLIFPYPYERRMRNAADVAAVGDPDWPTLRDGFRVTTHALRRHYICSLADELVPDTKIATWAGDVVGTIRDRYLAAMPERGDDPDRVRGRDVDAIERVWERGERDFANLPNVGQMWGPRPLHGS
jgi:integrase